MKSIQSPIINKALSKYELSRIQMTSTKFEKTEKCKSKPKTQYYNDLGHCLDHMKELYYNKFTFFNEEIFSTIHSTEDKIIRILFSKKYCIGGKQTFIYEKHGLNLRQKINSCIKNNLPLFFILPAFPFKIHNNLKSWRRDADLAEVAALLNLNSLALEIEKVYPKGAIFQIVHDGQMYCNDFLHSKEAALRYLNSLKQFVKRLGINSTIYFYDMKELIQDFSDFGVFSERAENEISKYWSENFNGNKIQLLIKSTINNLNTIDLSKLMLNIKSNSTSSNYDNKLYDYALKGAFKYMVTQHTLEIMDFFGRINPNGIRCTVHPKEAQIGLKLVRRNNYLLPWMGVGVIKPDQTISVRYQYTVQNYAKEIGIIKGDSTPFYYLI